MPTSTRGGPARPSTIGALFSADATYAYHPYDEPERGREAIVASWLSEPDAARSWEARYAPLVVEGDRAVATGETVYTDGRRFSNLFVLRFDARGALQRVRGVVHREPGGAGTAAALRRVLPHRG